MRLYRSILGSEFERLGTPLQEFHDKRSSAQGFLNVTHLGGRVGSWLARAMKMPKPGQMLDTRIQIDVHEDGETWIRKIGSSILTTRQFERSGFLHEKAGPLTFRFQLIEVDQGLEFHTIQTTFLGIPIPKSIAPSVSANIASHDNGWYVFVRFRMPIVGVICHYDGEITLP